VIYVAAPYTNVRDKIKLIERVNAYTVGLINRHYIVYSPLTHNHELAVAYDLPESFEYWQTSCRFFVTVSSEMHVLMLDGWMNSVGVQEEIRLAKELHLPIFHMTETEINAYSPCPRLI
jgi:hypothetical protein